MTHLFSTADRNTQRHASRGGVTPAYRLEQLGGNDDGLHFID